MSRSLAWLSTAALAVAGPLQGQAVRGVARDTANQRLIESGVITLLDARGAIVRAVLTDTAGRFAVLAPGAGTYSLRFERLGYRPITSNRFSLGRGESITRDLHPSTISVSLQEIVVTDRPRCRVLGEADTLTARVWTAVRGVLASAAAGETGWYPHVTIERFIRDYDHRNKLVNERTWTSSGTSSSPFVALAAAQLEKHGFAQRVGDSVVFYAPEARTLIAEEFLRTHCFRVRDDRVEHARVGLEIEPVPGRSLPDIKGTLWVDAASGELRRLEFTYVNLPSIVPDADAEGWVDFRRLDNGAWIVDNWAMRLPLVGQKPPTGPYGGSLPTTADAATDRSAGLLGVHEEGGRLVSLDPPSRGRTRLRPPATVAVRGYVRMASGAPVSGARAFLSGTGHSSVTDRDGRFEMLDVSPGKYRLSFTHPRFDTLGIVGEALDVDARRPAEHILTMPTDEDIARAACPGERAPPLTPQPSLIYGYVRDASKPAVVPGATVSVSWRQSALRGPAVAVATASVETESDAEGRYQLCGVPTDVPLTVQVERESRGSPELPLEALGAPVTRLDMDLPNGRARGR
ncbi:MAG: carboxypeptidase-like regulatory domain-containing protein [Gemmatimonadaceae bacterium]